MADDKPGWSSAKPLLAGYLRPQPRICPSFQVRTGTYRDSEWCSVTTRRTLFGPFSPILENDINFYPSRPISHASKQQYKGGITTNRHTRHRSFYRAILIAAPEPIRTQALAPLCRPLPRHHGGSATGFAYLARPEKCTSSSIRILYSRSLDGPYTRFRVADSIFAAHSQPWRWPRTKRREAHRREHMPSTTRVPRPASMVARVLETTSSRESWEKAHSGTAPRRLTNTQMRPCAGKRGACSPTNHANCLLVRSIAPDRERMATSSL